MVGLPPAPLWEKSLSRLLYPETPGAAPDGFVAEPLPSSRPVFRFVSNNGGAAVVGKFFSACPPLTSADRSLLREYDNYQEAARLGLNGDRGLLPRVLGRDPSSRLGLLLEAIPGPDLDGLIKRAGLEGDAAPLTRGLENLAELLARFHAAPLPPAPVSPAEGLAYLDKLRFQLQGQGLLTLEDAAALAGERAAWGERFSALPDFRVLVHGDATPTNFLFPGGRAVALDLERLRVADRLWDLSWVAGELKHAWAWRTGGFHGAEPFIRGFFAAYLAALPGGPSLAPRLYSLNPFYMALAELRIARNAYLSREYRGALVAEARLCLAGGRRI
jgi:aminoglycoside phosphotransferase